MVLCFFIFLNICAEIYQVYEVYTDYHSVVPYFTDILRLLDWVNMAVFVSMAYMWAFVIQEEIHDFHPATPYDIPWTTTSTPSPPPPPPPKPVVPPLPLSSGEAELFSGAQSTEKAPGP